MGWIAAALFGCAAGSAGAQGGPTETSAQETRSPRIGALLAALRSGRPGALDAFRSELEISGTPLVEPVPGRPDRALVTFVWFAEGDPDNVVVQSWLRSRSVEERAMRLVPGTRLWYRTFEAPADLAMGYLISPDDARLSSSSDEADVTATWVTDPLNPRRATGALGIAWSVVNLSDADPAPWMGRGGPRVPDERLVELEVESRALGQGITLRVSLPPGFEATGESYSLLLFFDGYGFFEIDQAHRLIEGLVDSGEIPAVVTAFIYNPDATRNRDMSCYDPTHRFLRDELIPLLRERFAAGGQARETIVAGRSRSGLGAVCAAYSMPDLIGGAIAQSGSFWWAPEGESLEWLARDMATSPRRPIRLYLDAGELEDGPNPDTGLSMLTVTRHLRDVARARGYDVHYAEFPGGHDPVGWRTTLPGALRAMFAGS